MASTQPANIRLDHHRAPRRIPLLTLGLIFPAIVASAGQNLLKNPGFEEGAPGQAPPAWTLVAQSSGAPALAGEGAHQGHQALALPANTAIEQKIEAARAGAYLVRAWVKSDADQSITLLILNPDEPWAAYNCAEIHVPRGEWTQIQSFCALDRDGPLTLSLGGMSKEFHPYHGTSLDMGSAMLVDDVELVRYEPAGSAAMAEPGVWDAGQSPNGAVDWAGQSGWPRVGPEGYSWKGTPVIEGGHLAGAVRATDGALMVYSRAANAARQRCVILPSPALDSAKYTVVRESGRAGLRVRSASGDKGYTAWFTDKGLIQIEPDQLQRIELQDCRLRYALLPSFAGTDLSYTPAEVGAQCQLPSTQWLVGLVDGNDSMLVAVWDTNAQPATLSATGAGTSQLIDRFSIGARRGGLYLSLVEHAQIWHREALQEDWLGDYTPIAWQRPFPARWMGRFHVSSGGKSTFRDPGIDYSFPFAEAKTRMWGVWFEDWNHYPFFFDGGRTMLHFEKSFVPQGEALIYFLEPAAADISSPVEIVEQALGHDRAMALFDLGANQLRKLSYSTPNEFMFDRPVCATTTRLSKIRHEDKPTIGVELATHLYEFIREIRGRVDQYRSFFSQTSDYLDRQAKTHPELHDYIDELQHMITLGQSQADRIYATPLPSVQEKIEKMKAQLREGAGDGFNCGNLDVRSTAGDQDDLCRRYNRFVIKLAQTAASRCGDSPAKAEIATYVWDQSRAVLRRPTRWEPRRTLYFFEP